MVRKILANGVKDNNVRNLQNRRNGPDIDGHFEFNTGRLQRRLSIEAKGGTVRYNFRTVLGQLLELMDSPSDYRWYDLALPADWQSYVYRRLTRDGNVNAVITLVIKNFSKNGQGLYFYWVTEEGDVSQSTWRTFLKNFKNKSTSNRQENN